jgi:hypothetical protein
MDSLKYNRTWHLPWSPGGTSDDRRLKNVEHFVGEEVVFTEKADGSNVCVERDACFARSHAGAPSHPSFDAFKAFHATVRGRIGEGMQVFGEWCFAKHSIYYTALPHYFLLFGVRDLRTMIWADWDEIMLWAEELEVPTAPLLWRGRIDSEGQLKVLTNSFANVAEGSLGGEREGVVVRLARVYHDQDFPMSIAKWVRENHVQTDDHWKTQEIVRNLLARG